VRAAVDKKKKITPVIFFFTLSYRNKLPFLVRNGQFFSSLGPPAGKDFAPVFAGHSLTETVLVFPLPYRWLKCSFHKA
jgi:hypothetical protein